MSRLATRFRIIPHAIARRVGHARVRPKQPQRILIAHHLLLGDTIMLTPLIAKLRMLYPHAYIAMTVPHKIAPLYTARPYGLEAFAYDPHDAASVARLLGQQAFDLAFVPGDNRYSWLAQAMGARWIVAFDGDRPGYKSWPVDELVPYPTHAAAWGDMVATLWPGPEPPTYRATDWPPPESVPFPSPPAPYCVLHVGASSPLKLWPAERWLQLADFLSQRGVAPVWSAGRGEESTIEEIDPDKKYTSFAGRLDLAQLWRLLSKAQFVVCPDTGVAHLARVIGVPTVALFGPGSHVVSGAGRFWADSQFFPVTAIDFPCRDQRKLFKRNIDWVRRCGRNFGECNSPLCMKEIDVVQVERSIAKLILKSPT